MEKEEIKNCPFCGKKPVIENEIRLHKNDGNLTPSHDLDVSWSIKCNQCGTSKKAFGYTYYKLGEDGILKIIPQTYSEKQEGYNDKRQEVIDIWNKRFN